MLLLKLPEKRVIFHMSKNRSIYANDSLPTNTTLRTQDVNAHFPQFMITSIRVKRVLPIQGVSKISIENKNWPHRLHKI